jgi:hypothetical protein
VPNPGLSVSGDITKAAKRRRAREQVAARKASAPLMELFTRMTLQAFKDEMAARSGQEAVPAPRMH